MCPAHNTKCHQCGRVGHYARRCRTMKNKRITTSSAVTRGQRQFFPRRINQVTEDNKEEGATSSRDIRNLECFKIGESNHRTRDDVILVKVGGVTINMLIDSGASCNIINGKNFQTLTVHEASMWNFERDVVSNLKSYAMVEPLKIKCRLTAPVEVNNGKETIDSFTVIENGTISLLGKTTSMAL